MNNIKIFSNDQFGQVRVVVVNGEPNFVAKDVCDILGLGNTSRAISRIKNRWVTKSKVPHPQSKSKTIRMNTVTEPGLYKLIMRSNKKEAEEFTDWIAEDVLPSIRRHGMYAKDELLDNPDLLIEVASQLKKEREEKKALKEDNQKKDQLIGDLKPKAEKYQEFLNAEGHIYMSQAAKALNIPGIGRNKLYQILREMKILRKNNEPYQKYMKYFWMKPNEKNEVVYKPTTMVKPGGLDFIYDKLKEAGYINKNPILRLA